MAHQKIFAARSDSHPLPFTADDWNAVIVALDIPAQEAKVVELVLRGLRDKQVAAALGVKTTTVRTYLQRTYIRLGVNDRMEVIVRVFATALKLGVSPSSHFGCPQK